MSLTVKPKVSSVVQYQVPEFIRNDHPLFPEFLAHYYKFLEQENQSLDVIRKTVDNLNVDRTSNQFLELIKRHVLPYNLNNAEAIVPDEQLIKYLRELYLAKGTEKSYEFVFNNLYNADIEMQYGKNFVFRSSDNEYPGFDSIILQDKVNNTILFGLAGNVISQPKGSAIVDKVELYNNPLVAAAFAGSISLNSPIVRAVSSLTGLKVGSIISDTLFALPKDTQIISINTLTNELTLSAPARSSHVNYALYAKDAYYVCLLKSNNSRGDFDPELPVSGTINTVGIFLDAITSVNSVSVSAAGALYKSGQRLNVIGGSGQNLLVEIDEVGPGGVEDIYIAQSGTGYVVGNIITFDDPTGKGVGAKAVVTAIDGYGAKLNPIMTIDAINKINGGYGYAVNDVISLDLPAIDGTKPKLIVNSVTSNILSAVKVTSGGHGYQYARAMFYVNGTNYWVTTPTIRNTILKTIPIPILAVTATPTLYINGSGCSGSLTVAAKNITGLTITAPGFNYVRPKIEIYADAGFVTKLAVTAPRLKFTLNTWSGVTAITLYDIIDIADAIYYYKVVEETGQGATAAVFMGGAILTASINTNKLFSSVNYKVAFVPTTDYVGLGLDASFYLSYKVNSINLVAGGAKYSTPTYIVQGNGSGFVGSIIVSAGLISAVVVVAPCEGYPLTSNIAITTSTGLTAVLTPVINDLGQVVSVKITNAGTLYNSSDTIAIVSGQTEATLTLTVTNGSVTVATTTTAGKYSRTPTVSVSENLATDYFIIGCSGVEGALTITTSGSFVNVKPGHRIYGAGAASFLQNVVVASVISSTQITIDRPIANTFGSQLLNFVISRGSISKIEVLQSGYGYTSLPNVVLPVQAVGNDPNLINAKIIPLSSTIGHIKSFRFIDQGINYEQRPLLTTPMVAITTSLAQMFSLNELVIDPDFVYPGGNYALGPHGYVSGIDSSKNIVYLENATDNFVFTLESGLGLGTESGDEIIHESSFLLGHSGKLLGTHSRASGSIVNMHRATVIAHLGAIVTNKAAFTTNSGFTSDSFIKLHDGKRIQDYSYYIKVLSQTIGGIKKALNLVEYRDTVSEMVHPAGFKMYGDVVLDDFQKLTIAVKKKLDRFGNEISGALLLSFLMQAASIFNDMNFNNPALNAPNFFKYNQIILLIDKYIQLFKDVDYNTPAGTAFKYRAVEILSQLNKLMTTPTTHKGTSIMHMIDYFEEAFPGFEPSDLEKIKFTIRPFDGMTETPHVVDSVTYNFLPGFAHTQNDLNYTGANANYWNYPNTNIGVFEDVVIGDFETNVWANSKNKYIVPDLFVVIAVKTI